MAYILQTVSVNPETGFDRIPSALTYHVAQQALNGTGGYQICFEPQDIPTLVEGGIVPQADIDYARTYGEIERIAVNPIDHNKRITLQAITKGATTGPHAGQAHSVPLREDDPRYGNPLREFDFLEFVRTHQG